MSDAVLEAVPNFSEGRRLDVVEAIVAGVGAVQGVEVVSQDSDPDHNRSVVTFLGPPESVAEAAVRSAHIAVDLIDLRQHEGVHPRIGSLDVLPFVPLAGATLKQAAGVARRVAWRIADELGIPVYLYGKASDPQGRRLHEIRRRPATEGGFPAGLEPDVLPEKWPHMGLHPTAGAVCVGARAPLLAWNVYLEGAADLEAARAIAASIRESGGGFPHLRALGLKLESQDRVQVSMNLEIAREDSIEQIYGVIDKLAGSYGGRAGAIEVVGLVPDEMAESFRRLGREDLAEKSISTCLVRYLGELERPRKDHQ